MDVHQPDNNPDFQPTSLPRDLLSRSQVDGAFGEFQKLIHLARRASPQERGTLCSRILQVLENPLVVQALIDDACLLNDFEKCGMSVKNIRLLSPVEEPSVSVGQIQLERIDLLDAGALEEMSKFPPDPERFLLQRPRTIPASADPDLFSRDKIVEFKERVKERTGDIDLKLFIARATITVNGVEFTDHPIHTLTTFEHEGQTMLGPFVGSTAGLLLRFCPEYSHQFKARVVAEMLLPLIKSPEFASVTIAFPRPHRYNPISGKHEIVTEALEKSASFRVLNSPPLNFSFIDTLDESSHSDPSREVNHAYQHLGPNKLRRDRLFLDRLVAIREVRGDQLLWLKREENFEPRERGFDGTRRTVTEQLYNLDRKLCSI